ncbi:MAG: KpsF/GutQ family sugar-phosphate isomerase [Thermoguttaceae bacterium]|nr:KpsF/GutQ family sugar-phosphate isomerase [Thermoguttaceae bacterium]MDW8038430.1 KpsF/GutQ family sugar-phosphate isomerase [Thermoguttaceae bacterium]
MEALRLGELSPFEQVRYGREILAEEARALAELARQLGPEFSEAVQLILACRGCVLVTGIGKAGLVGQKIMATLASTGTPAHFLHPAEAVHGDLGRVQPGDLLLVLSYSGETEEIVRLLPSFREIGVPILAITARRDSSLGRAAQVVLAIGPVREACPLGLAPTTSTTLMLALGDALALVVSRMKQFGREDFARFHPAGTLGRKLSRVEDHMRPLEQCRVASERLSVREVFVAVSRPGRRTGAIMLVDGLGRLSGIFTDSDLARLFERKQDHLFDRPISEVMTRQPITILLGSRMSEAVHLMAQKKISELPVVDSEGHPIGLIDITDIVGIGPEEAVGEERAEMVVEMSAKIAHSADSAQTEKIPPSGPAFSEPFPNPTP